MGRLVTSIKQAGIDPNDIDAVIPTHAHIDHIGGIMAQDGSRNFPNAQIYISQADLEFWTDDKRLGTPAEGSALAAKKNLLPNRDRIVFYKDGAGRHPGCPGHAHPRPHGGAYLLRDQFRRQIIVSHRRPYAPCHSD